MPVNPDDFLQQCARRESSNMGWNSRATDASSAARGGRLRKHVARWNRRKRGIDQDGSWRGLLCDSRCAQDRAECGPRDEYGKAIVSLPLLSTLFKVRRKR